MNKICPTILNIAAGKFQPLDLENQRRFFLVNLDPMYYSYSTEELIEDHYGNHNVESTITHYCNSDAYEFMERTKMIFDKICIYRFLEHVPMDKVLYFIYLVSTITKKGSEIDVIVPNYNKLAVMLLGESVNRLTFEKENILLTTELLNEPSCPHASIWTEQRVKYFWEMEERFKVKEIYPSFNFDGRNIYIRFKAVRL